MTELYLRLLDRFLTPILILLAIFLLVRGHNNPGGGFIAGLMVAAVLQLLIMGGGEARIRTTLGKYLHPMMGFGLLIAVFSGVVGLTEGAFLKGVWWHIPLGPYSFDFGTPVAFDIGVFLVVISVVTSFLLGLSRRDERNDGGAV